MGRKSGWTDAEREYIRKNAGILKDRQIAVNLTKITGRKITADSVSQQRRRVLGIKKAHGHGVCRIVSDKSDKNKSSTE